MDVAELLTRDAFREGVFARDGHRCVHCGAPAMDAHHIIERRLWPDGGYYLENGASLCGDCHLLAEQTVLSCDQIRNDADIGVVLLPPHLYDDFEYDKWGNIVLPNGHRLRGELFGDASVQKILEVGGVLDLFVPYVKYPRTHHLPWSNPSKDDRVIDTLDILREEEVVVTVKMDGEQTNMYTDHFHARSLDMATGEERARGKAIWGRICGDIPCGWRVCGENLYARHSIHYTNLNGWFYLFGIWNDQNQCLNWDETKEWAQLFDVPVVPELYRGSWDEEKIHSLYRPTWEGCEMEGYVVRVARSFSYGEFKHCVAKYVRPGHVTTATHWRHQRIRPNALRSGLE